MNSFHRYWQRLEIFDRPSLPYVIFLIAFAVRIAGVFLTRQYLDLDRFELERTAISLAHTGVYGNPYAVPTGPTAHVSPGYTLILASLFWLFGTGIKAEIIKQTFASAVTAFQCALIIPVAKRLSLDFRAGLLAALFCAIFPTKFATETMGDWENPYTAIALMLLSVLMVNVYRKRRFHLRKAAWVGVAWGIAILFTSVLLPVFCVMLAAGFLLAGRDQLIAHAKFCVVSCVLMIACLSPWIVRNYFALGSPIATRTNLGLELHLSNNPQAVADERENFLHGVYNLYHPLQNREEALKVRAMGEVLYNKLALQKALNWIEAHPSRFAKLTVERFGLYWFYLGGPGSLHENLKYAGLAFIHLLGLIGVALLFNKDRITATVWTVILCVEPLAHYLVHVTPRHSYDIDWILTLSAAAVLVSSITFRFNRALISPSEPRVPERVFAASK